MKSFLILSTAIPVIHETISLCELGGRIGEMTGKEEVVPGLDFPSETHEDHRVGGESRSHRTGDDLLILF